MLVNGLTFSMQSEKMPAVDRYTALICDAYESGEPIAASDIKTLTFEEANDVQLGVLARLGHSAEGFKVSLRLTDGTVVAAPMFDASCIANGERIDVSGAALIGIELEFAFKLKSDITVQMALAGIDGILPAIDHCVFGLEILQTRLADRVTAGQNAQLADNLSNGGYVTGGMWRGRIDPGDYAVRIAHDGLPIFEGRAFHPLGHPLLPILAYALSGKDRLAMLQPGTLITTGGICGALRLPGSGHVTASVDGEEMVSAELVVNP